MKVVGGKLAEKLSQEQEVIELLERCLEDLKSGKVSSNNALVLLFDDSEVDTFDLIIRRQCRNALAMGILAAAQHELGRETLED